jgi:hypothetical protein
MAIESESAITFDRNHRSRSNGISGQNRNTHNSSNTMHRKLSGTRAAIESNSHDTVSQIAYNRTDLRDPHAEDRCVRDVGVAGSNPVTPTIEFNELPGLRSEMPSS